MENLLVKKKNNFKIKLKDLHLSCILISLFRNVFGSRTHNFTNAINQVVENSIKPLICSAITSHNDFCFDNLRMQTHWNQFCCQNFWQRQKLKLFSKQRKLKGRDEKKQNKSETHTATINREKLNWIISILRKRKSFTMILKLFANVFISQLGAA